MSIINQWEARGWYLKSFLHWGPGFGRREGGVQGALFLANENRLDWLWERAWFQLYWRQAYCVNAIPPTTTTLSSIYSLWHVFSSITFGCALFLSFLSIFFSSPLFRLGIKQKESSSRLLWSRFPFCDIYFCCQGKNWSQRVKITLTMSIFKCVVWHAGQARVHATESHVIIIIALTLEPFYNFDSQL